MITFSQTIEYGSIGRNGYSHAAGVTTARYGDLVVIRPLNTRGNETQCRISVPVSSIPELIKELQAYV